MGSQKGFRIYMKYNYLRHKFTCHFKLLELTPIMYYHVHKKEFWALLVWICVSQMAFTVILSKTATSIDSVVCHYISYMVCAVDGVSE